MDVDVTTFGITLTLLGGLYGMLRWTINGRLDEIRSRLEDLDENIRDLNAKVTKLCAQLSECKTDIEWLKDNRGK